MITKDQQSDLESLIMSKTARAIECVTAEINLDEANRKLTNFIYKLVNPPQEKE